MRIATIVSCSLEKYSRAWQVMFTYEKDDGTEATASITFWEKIPWTSPDSIAEVKVPGCKEPIGLPCPEQIKASAFGVGG